LGADAQATAAACPHYRWLGGLPYAATRQRMQRAHLLVHPSRMEGGAHVVMEAVCSGTPVLASRIAGNVGMLGAGYAGYFEPGDAEGLAHLLRQARASQGQADGLLARLAAQCAARAPLFAPAAERQSLLALVAELMTP
jgi:glycosyltransferase involved in cell wall biosynthesis